MNIKTRGEDRNKRGLRGHYGEAEQIKQNEGNIKGGLRSQVQLSGC